MTKKTTLMGRLQPSNYAKPVLAGIMYRRGKNFFGAAVLVERQENSDKFVALHLLCQGIEITLKSLLLLKDFDKYDPELRKLGHDLEKLAASVIGEFPVKPLAKATADELKTLNGLYKAHLLRYATSYDILVDASTIDSDRVFMKIAAVIRLSERHLAKKLS